MNRRHLTVKLNLRGRDLTSFLNEAQNTINEKVHYDKNKYTIKWGGAFENQKRAYTRLAVIIPLTLTGMFILLYVTFGKFRQAGLVLAIVPLALFGGMLALNVRGMTLNVSSAVGFIAMFGLSIHCQRSREKSEYRSDRSHQNRSETLACPFYDRFPEFHSSLSEVCLLLMCVV